jgi:branched-chain amino acid transport system ATP-binding protein
VKQQIEALSIRDLTVRRSGSMVVRGVSLEVPRGSLVALLGANGAGKSSVLDAISGVIPSRGEIDMGARRLQGTRSSTRARRGLAYIEQGRTVFGDMSVEQNLLVVSPRKGLQRAWEVFPELQSIRSRRAELLSGGQQQMLMIARAVLASPRYLLVDELSLGLAPSIIRRLLPVIREQVAAGAGVLLVEQFAQAALQIADYVYVLARGRIGFAGSPEQLRGNPLLLRDAYLGGELDAASQADTTLAASQE